MGGLANVKPEGTTTTIITIMCNNKGVVALEKLARAVNGSSHVSWSKSRRAKISAEKANSGVKMLEED